MKIVQVEPFLRRFIFADGKIPALRLCVSGGGKWSFILTRGHGRSAALHVDGDVSFPPQRFLLVGLVLKRYVIWVCLLGFCWTLVVKVLGLASVGLCPI